MGVRTQGTPQLGTTKYGGVYSEISAGTSVGSQLEVDPKGNKIKGLISPSSKRDRHTFTSESLATADINVAKIRVVSTIPNKEVDKEIKDKAYVGFILTEVQENHSEKLELVPLPGDTYASYFYGASPRQFSFSGVLLNTDQDQWRDSFEQLYEEYLRGSASSRNFNIVQIRYGGRIVSGWLLNMSQQQSSQSDLYAQFSFSVLVSRIDMLNKNKSKYTDYLIEQGKAFDEANLSDDYAILDHTNYNALIDPIRTATAVPPKRPRRGGRRRGNNGCYFTNIESDGGADNLNLGSTTISDHINDATTCTVWEATKSAQDKIRDINDELKRKTDDRTITEPERKRLTNRARKLTDNLNLILNSEAVRNAVYDQADADLVAAAKRSAAPGDKDKIKTLADIPRIKAAQKRIDNKGKLNLPDEDIYLGNVKVATVSYEVTTDSKGKTVVGTVTTPTQIRTTNEATAVQLETTGTLNRPLTPDEENNVANQTAIRTNNAAKVIKEKEEEAKRRKKADDARAAEQKSGRTTVRQGKDPKKND